MTASHWSPPDTWGDILAAAWQPDAPAPVAIHVSPVLHARLVPERDLPEVPGAAARALDRQAGVPVVLDEEVPEFPGFEVHRAPPDDGTGPLQAAS